MYESTPKKGLTVGKILRWIVYCLILFIYLFYMIRIIISCNSTPGDTKKIIIDEVLSQAIDEKELTNLTAYKISPRTIFGDGDTFYLSDVVYIEDTKQLQFTIRMKRQRINLLMEDFRTSQIYDFKAVINHMKKAETPPEQTTTGQSGDGTQVDYTWSETPVPMTYQSLFNYNFEKATEDEHKGEKYIYIRYLFNDVDIDYVNSRIELTMHITTDYAGADKTDEMHPEPVEQNLLATFTMFDVNTEKSKANLNKYEFNRIAGN